ncbi:ribonuclease YeeF family protein [Amphibacillus cookii]|uniref:ribonuclease YeeF family protein n=1 Tax=Amphibacillus cookii TaxID=767787 RepID=UPI001956F2B7|nr:T7SS effector LXG polymorphic toxin [Amphibacillus cookii]MBM7541220.1 putative ribonuclease toxin of YeeF-YezG toxin-antitoxin module [Amphibacillus cookii]
MKQLNAERLRDTMEARVKHYQDYREQFEQLRHSFEEIVGLEGFEGRGAEAIKGFYQGQMDVIDAWYRFIDHQIAFFEGVSGTLSDFELGGQTKVDSPFLSEDLARREVQADEMISDQQQTLEQIFSGIEDIMTLRPFSRDAFDQQMSSLHQKRVETIEAVEDIDELLSEEYHASLPEQSFLMELFDELFRATLQGGDVSTIHFDANAYHNSDVYKNIEDAEAYTAEYLNHKQEQAHARELQDRAWYEVLWDGTKTFVGEATGYYDSIRASTGVDPVTGVEYTAGQRIAYAGLAAAGFIPFVGWAGKAIKGGKGIYATTKGVKAVNTSLDIYKTANTFSTIQKAEMGLYGLAAANGFSEYITGKDVLGNELTAEQRSASLSQGILGSTLFAAPFAPDMLRGINNAFKPKKLTGLPSQAKKIDFKAYTEVYETSVKNANANKVMLGKYDGGGQTSYITRAGKDHTYFDLGAQWGEVKKSQGLTDNDMFKLYNEAFLDDVINARKTVHFSHNPVGDKGFLGLEYKYLKRNNYIYDSSTMRMLPK